MYIPRVQPWRLDFWRSNQSNPQNKAFSLRKKKRSHERVPARWFKPWPFHPLIGGHLAIPKRSKRIARRFCFYLVNRIYAIFVYLHFRVGGWIYRWIYHTSCGLGVVIQSPLAAIWAIKKRPGWLGFIGDYSAQLYGDYVINHEIRIPIKQPVFRRKLRDPVFFFAVHFPKLHCRFTAEDSNGTTLLFGYTP